MAKTSRSIFNRQLKDLRKRYEISLDRQPTNDLALAVPSIDAGGGLSKFPYAELLNPVLDSWDRVSADHPDTGFQVLTSHMPARFGICGVLEGDLEPVNIRFHVLDKQTRCEIELPKEQAHSIFQIVIKNLNEDFRRSQQKLLQLRKALVANEIDRRQRMIDDLETYASLEERGTHEQYQLKSAKAEHEQICNVLALYAAITATGT